MGSLTRLSAGVRGWLVSARLAGAGAWLGCGGMSEGEPLTGGSQTRGIVRIGDTVRWPLRPFSLTVQAYLAHLRDAGFTGAPLPPGIDEAGLIRALHEASAGWVPPAGAVWGGMPASRG
jgi:hypothetical protein